MSRQELSCVCGWQSRTSGSLIIASSLVLLKHCEGGEEHLN